MKADRRRKLINNNSTVSFLYLSIDKISIILKELGITQGATVVPCDGL